MLLHLLYFVKAIILSMLLYLLYYVVTMAEHAVVFIFRLGICRSSVLFVLPLVPVLYVPKQSRRPV